MRTSLNESYSTIESPKKKKGKRRGSLPKSAKNHLKKWLFANFNHPYPTEDQKAQLARETGLSHQQVNYWFINARVRIWRPMLETIQNGGPQPPQLQQVANNNNN